MLQWMGGSRRKVTNSRKSTHKRQKQYFEQKKRQQRTNGLDDDAEGTHRSTEYHQTPKSLDILSLLNLTEEAKGDNSGCTKATDGPALRVSPVNYQFPEDIHKATEIPVLRFSPVAMNCQLQNDTRIKSPAKEEKCASPQKKFSCDPHNTTSFHKYSSNKNGDKSDCWKKTTETQFSLLELLGEDGSNEKAEGSPVHECHVAFSVEGLGKTRMGTPVHSPQQQCRFPSPPKAAKRHLSSNKYKINELKQNGVSYDIDMPTSQSSFDLPFNSGDIRDTYGDTRSDNLFVKGCKPDMPTSLSSFDFPFKSRDARDNHGNTRSDNLFVKGCKPRDDLDFKSDSLFTEGCFNNNLEDKSQDPWNARSDFLDDDFTDEKMLCESTTSQLFETDYSSDDLCRENTYNMHAFAFDDPYLQKRKNSHNIHAFSFEDPYQKREKSPNMHAFAFEDPYVLKRENIYNTHEFAFEDPYLLERSSVKTQRDISSGFEPTTPCFEHLHSRMDKDFITFDGTRRTDRKWDFNEPAWSYFENEDLKDNMSLLSEESSSSTAGWRDKAKHSTLNPMGLEDSMRKHESDLHLSPGNMYNTKHLYAERKGSGKQTGVTKLSRRKEIFKVKKDLTPKFNALYGEEYTSVDMELSHNSFLRTPLESNPTSLDCKFGSEGLSSVYPYSKLYTNKQPLGKRRTPDAPSKQPPPFRFEEDVFQQPLSPVHSDPHSFWTTESLSRKLGTPHSKLYTNKQALGKRRTPDAPSKQAPPFSFEEDVFQQPLSPVHSVNSFSITEPISRKLDTPQKSRTEVEPPYSSHTIDPHGGTSFPALARESNDGTECEDRPEHQQSDCGFLPEIEKEVSVWIDGFLCTNKHALGKRLTLDAPSKQAPPYSSEKDVIQQPLSPVHSDPNSFSITESISRKLDTPQMSRTEGEPHYSSYTLDPQGGAAFPSLARERNDDTECEDRLEHQQSDCGLFSEKEKEVAVGVNGFLSQHEKTVTDSDYKDSQSKYKGIREKTPELVEKSKARDSSEISEETSCAAKEIPDKLEICVDDIRHHFHAGLPLPIQSGRKGNEETEELERVDGGKREKSKNTAYMVMLESYVLQLLCVQKVLKEGTSEHEPLSQ